MHNRRPLLRSARQTAGPLSFFAALAAVVGFRVLVAGETFFLRDLYLYFIPQRRFFLDRLAAGEFPLWQPTLHGGVPFAADMSNSAFYPPIWLWSLLSAARAVSWDILLHLFLASLGAFWLARICGLRPLPAMLAGTVYAYCGYSLSQHNLLVRLLSLPYLPLVVASWHLWLLGRQRRWLATAAALGCLQVFAGGPLVCAATALTTLAWILTAEAPRRALGAWLLLWTTVAGLSAIQLAPMADLVSRSVRGAGYGFATFSTWSVHPTRLPELVLPRFFGRTDGISESSYWGAARVDQGFPYITSLYFGAVALALATLGWWPRGRALAPRRLRLVLALLAGGGVILSLGRHLWGFQALYEVVPFSQLARYPVKLMTLAVLPIALLAGAGAERFAYEPWGRRARCLVVAGSSALLFLWLALTYNRGFADLTSQVFFLQVGSQIRAGLESSSLQAALAFAAFATLALASRRMRPRLVAAALLLLVATDLLLASRGVAPTAPLELFTATPPLAERVRATIGEGRLFRDEVSRVLELQPPSDDVQWLYRWRVETLWSYLGAAYSLPVIYHVDFTGLVDRRMALLTSQVSHAPLPTKLPLLSAAAVKVLILGEDPRLPELDRLATLQGTANERLVLLSNEAAADRLTLVDSWASAASPEAAMAAMLRPGFDPRRHAVIERVVGSRIGDDCGRKMRWRAMGREVNSSRYEVSAPCGGYLVMAEPYDPGWQTLVDGDVAESMPANVAFTAVALESGEHVVERRFRPRGLRLGAAVSLLTALLLLVGLTHRPRLTQRRLVLAATTAASTGESGRRPPST